MESNAARDIGTQAKDEGTMKRCTQLLNRRRQKRSGTAILEMALTLTLLLNLTFGMVEVGYYFYVKNAFECAAREGARTAMVPGGTTSLATTAVTNALAAYKFPSGCVTATVTDTSGNTLDPSVASQGTAIQMNISATWSVVGAGFRPLSLIGGSKIVTGYCVMLKE